MFEAQFISVKEAAVIFSVNQATIRRAIRKGLIIGIRVGDGKKSHYRLSIKSIEDIHEIIRNNHRQISAKNSLPKNNNIS